MKVQTTNEKEEFKPVTLTITLETQEELDLLAGIFNSAFVADFLRAHADINTAYIYEALKEKGADVGKYPRIFADYMYESLTVWKKHC